PPEDILDVPESYKFGPILLPAIPRWKLTTEPRRILGPSQPGSSPVFSGVLTFLPPVSRRNPGTPATPGPGNGGSTNPGAPATPGPPNGGSTNPSTPATPGPPNGGSTNPGAPATPGPPNGGSTNPGAPAMPSSDYGTVGGTDAPPIVISDDTGNADG